MRAAIERHGWRPYTRHSIADFARLEAELATVRAQGYAIDREERRAEVICMAAPIRDRAGEVVAAISVSGSKTRMTEAFRRRVLPPVVEAAARVSFRLGCQPTRRTCRERRHGLRHRPGDDGDSWKVVKRAEELGFTHAWFYDTQMLTADCFVAMGAAAMKTSRIRLGTGVLIPSNRIAAGHGERASPR